MPRPLRPWDWGLWVPKWWQTFLIPTLPEKLFLCQQFSKIVPSAYGPWAWGEALKISNPISVFCLIFKGAELRFHHELTILYELRAPFDSHPWACRAKKHRDIFCNTKFFSRDLLIGFGVWVAQGEGCLVGRVILVLRTLLELVRRS